MSLNLSLLNALSGLQVNQRLLDLTSQNIANVNTAGYSRKVATQESITLDGMGSGVRLGAVTRNVNEALLADLRQQSSFLGESDALDTFYGRMQDLFGTPDSESSIASLIGLLANSFQSMAANPEDSSTRMLVVNNARFLTSQFNSIAGQVQALRQEADSDITDAVALINDRLNQIADLNLRIAQGTLLGQQVVDLQDQRDRAVNDIAQNMDIRYFIRDNGEMVVFTASGRAMLDRTANLLSHTAAGSMSPTITWASGSIGGIMLNGADITSEIGSGKLAGLIQLRDTTLPNLASQFDELAAALNDEINALHNQGTSFPGADSLTGTRRFTAADAPLWSGTARVMVTDSTGTVVEVLDVNLGATASVDALRVAINGMTNADCAYGPNGELEITATGGNKIAISEMDSAVTVGSRTVGWGEFLGLNDFFTAGVDYATYTSAQQTSGSAALGLAGNLSVSGPFGTGVIAYTAGNSLTDVAAAINADATLAAAGVSASVVVDGSGFRLRIQDSGGQNFFLSDSGNLVATLGIKAHGTQTAADLSVRSDILADPGRVAFAAASSDPALVAGNIGVTAGDNSIVQAIANRFNQTLSFGATGQLAAANKTLADYGASIVALNASQAQGTKDTLGWRKALFENLSHKAASISAVNLDEETANMVLLQNAYAASARVISTTAELFNVLMSIGR
jgi:flagellar hook-associated protein 1 FlgK